ncbi:MAG TPA: FAD-binding protein, partial [Verrucomicrobiales bacterium]|nr:FAD-binding protein [Verrucomicrobiales bacterium]
TAKQAGGGGQVAPAQRVTDFLKGAVSSTLPKTSYFPGTESVDLNELLPAEITRRLKQGFTLFGNQMPGYITDSAILIGFETRTSSPVRIPRDPDSLEHPMVKGLYPCGEGAGYAGGIVSAALDGLRCAQAIKNA